jgi:alkaline phosphatase
MATSSTPLLHRPEATDDVSETESSVSSEEHKHWFRRLTSRQNVLPFFGTLVATLCMVLAITLLTTLDPPQRKNVVLMVSDGMGPGSLSLARSFMQYKEDVEFYKQLALDPYIVGTSRTRSHG